MWLDILGIFFKKKIQMYLCYLDGVRIYLIQIDKLIFHLDIKNLVFRCYYLVNIFLFYMEKKRETITGFPNLEFSCAVCVCNFCL